MATAPLTDDEIEAWKRHPDTFFGEVRQVHKQVKNWIELALFFYENYKNTAHELLLEWMRDAEDIAYLKTLSQKDLAITYCERLGWAAGKQAAT